MLPWLFCGAVSIIHVMNAEAREHLLEIHTYSDLLSNGGTKDTIHWRLCHDTSGTHCGVFQHSKWSRGNEMYLETYKVPYDLHTIERIDIVNEGKDELQFVWLAVDGKTVISSFPLEPDLSSSIPSESFMEGETIIPFSVSYSGGSSQGCGVFTVHTTKGDDIFQFLRSDSYDNCPYKLYETYAPTPTPIMPPHTYSLDVHTYSSH